MTARPADLISHLRQLAAPTASGTESDAVLLERYVRDREEAAFAALVARHGPMVRRVCGRVLADTHAADDAFQATFLVLARRAGAASGKKANTAKRPAWPRMPMIMVVRQPSALST